MTEIDDAVRRAVRDLADTHGGHPTPGLADRALTSVERKRRRAIALVPVAVLTLLAGTAAVLWPGQSPGPGVRIAAAPDTDWRRPPRAYLVSAFSAASGHEYVYDPGADKYRRIPGRVAATAPNLRYALTSTITDGNPDRTRMRYAIVETATGRTVYETTLGAAQVSWSPDGRWIAFAHITGPNMEERYLDRVRLLDLSTGTAHEHDLEPRGWIARNVLSWSADARSLYFTADPGPEGGQTAKNSHIRMATDGTVTVIEHDWPPEYVARGVAIGTDSALLAHQYEGRPWVVLDLATGREVERYSPARTVPVNPGGDTVWGVVGRRVVLTAAGQNVLATDTSTGTRRRVATLPEAAVSITVAPAPRNTEPPAFSPPGVR